MNIENNSTQSYSEIDNLLQQNIEKDIHVKIKEGSTIQGNLKAFDRHLNLCLSDGIIKKNDEITKFKNTLLRGSDILVILL